MKKLLKFFYNRWYRIQPPELVQYWKWGSDKESKDLGAYARIGKNEDGSFKMVIQGEKYDYPGFPRGHVLLSQLGKLKHEVKLCFNESRAKIQKFMDETKYNIVPPEHLSPAVKELWRAFGELENAEVTEDMKGRIRLYRDVMCYWFQEDDAYRFRFQWLLEHLDMKKMRLSKADKYYFRGKYFKVDNDKFDY